MSHESSCWEIQRPGYLLKYMFIILFEKNLWNRGEPGAVKVARPVRGGIIDVPNLSKDKWAWFFTLLW